MIIYLEPQIRGAFTRTDVSYESVFRRDLFSGQNIIVTGGGSGIGRCIAHEIASLGGKVILTGRSTDKLLAVQEEIAADGGSADTASFDIRDEDAVVEAVKSIVDAHDQIHGLVNNAGGQFVAPMEKISANGFDAVVRGNLTGGFLVAREVVKQSMREHGGAIVNMSADFRSGAPGMAHSGASRAGMENLTQTAAWEWGGYGVRVNAVAPGLIQSSGLDTYPDEVKALIGKADRVVPLKRFGTEAEVSAAVCFLLSPGASYMSGATLLIRRWRSERSDTGAVWPARGTFEPRARLQRIPPLY